MPAISDVFGTLLTMAGLGIAMSLVVRALLADLPKKNSSSLVWVAECWLEWPLCRGSTMYRRGFKSARAAQRAAKLHAWLLDLLLPSHYRAEYSDGRPYWESYDFSIKWGVRSASCHELAAAVTPIWATTLPGSEDFAGEHVAVHPLQRQP